MRASGQRKGWVSSGRTMGDRDPGEVHGCSNSQLLDLAVGCLPSCRQLHLTPPCPASTTSPTVYLISGANRGIGLGLVKFLAKRDNVVVFAGARNPSLAKELEEPETLYTGKVHTVELTSCDKEDNLAAVQKIKKTAGRLDVVIANAGIAKWCGPIMEVQGDVLAEHFDVNVMGPITLFPATYPLLEASTDSPKFVCISTLGSTISLGSTIPAGLVPYGASKCALNWVARHLSFEHPGLICYPMHPGELVTAMCTFAMQNPALAGMQPFSVDDGMAAIMKVIDETKRDEENGPGFMSVDGKVWPW
ncbi:NAD(P)-binding protein [Calocera cornea HHB12733]|uniref:NAD(P)-binding protein n=1 Tax=Calocera cornea HHB12733 TaxID=1353952 RepID=A0A165E8Y3_9BASI|nr:NAD(P)-binding protein [Calocera cornea HHB12733]